MRSCTWGQDGWGVADKKQVAEEQGDDEGLKMYTDAQKIDLNCI